MSTEVDARHMRRALELARRGLFTTDPNPRVGCVLVRDGRVVGEGWHVRAGEAHAEVNALARAGGDARGATAYVTLEPCAHHGRTGPCAQALIDAGVRRVVAAMEDPNPLVAGAGLARLRAAGVRVECGLSADAALALNPGFVQRMRLARPWTRLKLAASLDARTALASGESKWITGPAARADVHRFRARSSAVVTGVGTVLADDPALTARPTGRRPVLQPIRVILDPRLRTPPTARVLREPGATLLIATPGDTTRRAALEAAGAEVVVLDAGPRPEPGAVLTLLAARGVNEVWVECGPTLAGAFLAASVVDELIVYLAPTLLGDDARALMRLPPLRSMAARPRLSFTDVRRFGDDLRITARPAGRIDDGQSL